MYRRKVVSAALAAVLSVCSLLGHSGGKMVYAEETNNVSLLGASSGIYSNTYYEPGKDNRNWCEGMVSGNGKNGVITSGSPYSDTLIYQNISFNMPNNNYREVLPEIEGDLDNARQAVINNDWKSWNYTDQKRQYYYTFHPGHQLRLTIEENPYENYERWTNYETAEVGVAYTDRYGQWKRTTFTSRADDVTITRIEKSSTGQKVNLTVSIDNVSDLRGFGSGPQGHYEDQIEYKKIVDSESNYIAEVVHYPVTERGTEYNQAGFAGVTQIVTVGGEKERVTLNGEREKQNVGSEENPGIKISNAEAVYLITKLDKTFEMGSLSEFKDAENYRLIDDLYAATNAVAEKYTDGGSFCYEDALEAHVKLHKPQFEAVKLDLNASSADRALSSENLLKKQQETDGLNEAFVERAYYAGRYAQLCCSGYSTSRLGGMWTGEWNSAWGGLWTTDANVNLQVSAMNTGNIKDAPMGYINFILRQVGDWQINAEKVYGMHDAIQATHNTDGESAYMIQSDGSYPFQYWNSGASWLLLPIYEYWQCYGNQQIPIAEDIDLYKIRGVLGTEDGGLSEEKTAALYERGWLDLEKDILLPLLTKQSNFWEQLCTPEYYTDADGNHHYEPGKKSLAEGERYMIIPSYSPENSPKGSYTKSTALNATMDIAAARDGLDMTIAMEKAVNGETGNLQIARWSELKSKLPEYQLDGEPGSTITATGGGGALREWATQTYTENNGHRHLSHLYAAWPGYETRQDSDLEEAARQALKNRIRLNTGDSSTGHGWIHQTLIAARLGEKDIVADNMYHLMSSRIYFTSMMTDHNTGRQSDAYCTDTALGMLGVINESLLYSNTGEIEVLPTLLKEWKAGSIDGLKTRTRATVDHLEWDTEKEKVIVEITSDIDQTIEVTSGEEWKNVKTEGGEVAECQSGGKLLLKMNAGEKAKITFTKVDEDLLTANEDTRYAINVYWYAQTVMHSGLAEILSAKQKLIQEKTEALIHALEQYHAGAITEVSSYADDVLEAVKTITVLGGSSRIDDKDPKVRFGKESTSISNPVNWGKYDNSKYYSGSISTFKDKDNERPYTEFTFTGERVAFWTELAQNAVINELWIDGKKIDEKDAYENGNGTVTTLFDTKDYDLLLDEGEHTIRIVGAAKSEHAASYIFRSDGFEVWDTEARIADVGSLIRLISAAQNLKAEEYTDSTYGEVQQKLEEAVAVGNIIDTDQQTVDKAQRDLESAMENLKRVDSEQEKDPTEKDPTEKDPTEKDPTEKDPAVKDDGTTGGQQQSPGNVSPQTGDTYNVYFIIGIFVVSLLIIIALMVVMYKKKDRR